MQPRQPESPQAPQIVALPLNLSSEIDRLRLVAFVIFVANAFFFFGFNNVWRALALGRG
jgi:hypothetical protein